MPKSHQTQDRCWPGYEPVPGKKEHSQGSCRPKSKADLKTKEKKFRSVREKQLDRWQEAHSQSPRKAAQHLHAPKASRRKTSSQKSSTPKSLARKRSAR